MKTSRFNLLLIAVSAVVVALLIALAVGLILPGSSTSKPKTTFSIPLRLSTSAINSSNPYGCGTNSSVYLSFAADATVHYYVAVNSSADRADYWTIQGGTSSPEFVVLYGSLSDGSFAIGAAGATVQFLFRGCGAASPVLVTLWGNFMLPASG